MGIRRALSALVVVVLALAGTQVGAAAQQPDSNTQPVADGCQRDPLGLIAGTTPHWAYVNRDPAPQYLAGTARNARPTETDLFSAHDSYDMNAFFAPDPAFHDYLGTANTSTATTQSKDEQDTMEIEWEQRAWSLFAWPTAGDRMELLGSWIWDCGHWGPGGPTDPTYFQPGTQPGEVITGERTEIHPPRMVIVHRRTPSVSDRGDAVTDALISSNGTFATADENHSSGACATPPRACSQWVPVNDRDYQFDVAAPPKPAGATKLQWSVVDEGTQNAPDPTVTEIPGGIRVTVPFKGFGKDGDPMVFAKRFLVGWNVAPPVHHLRVTLEKLDWLAELDGPVPFTCVADLPCTGQAQQSTPPDEVVLYVEAAGQWHQLNDPKLLAIAPGDSLPLSDTYDVYVPDGAPWRVYSRGRECDMPNMAECPTPTEIGFNDAAGITDDEYVGASAVGRHVAEAPLETCQNSAGSSCFRLTYRVEEVKGAATLPGQAQGAGSSAAEAATPRGSLPATGGTDGWTGAVIAALGVLGLVVAGRSRLRPGRR